MHTIQTRKDYLGVLKSLIIQGFRGNIFSNRRVNFFVVGAQKAGTTALYEYLRLHNEIGVPVVKELHVFHDNMLFKLPKYLCYIHFHRYFKNYRIKEKKLCEFTPVYMARKKAIERIYQYNQKAKLVIILRDPTSRAFSAWNMYRMRGWEKRSFEEAINDEMLLDRNSNEFRYLDRGWYATHIKYIMRFFSRDQVLIIFQQDLRKNPLETINRITRFFQVSRFESIKPIEAHSREYEVGLSVEMDLKLRAYYIDEITELEMFLSVSLQEWKILGNDVRLVKG